MSKWISLITPTRALRSLISWNTDSTSVALDAADVAEVEVSTDLRKVPEVAAEVTAAAVGVPVRNESHSSGSGQNDKTVCDRFDAF